MLGEKSAKVGTLEFVTRRDDLGKVIQTVHMIDGSFLLQQLIWEPRENFSSVITKCIEYLKNTMVKLQSLYFPVSQKFLQNMTPSLMSISAEVASIEFVETMSLTFRNEYFLANEDNERRLIKILIEKLEQDNLIYSTRPRMQVLQS